MLIDQENCMGIQHNHSRISCDENSLIKWQIKLGNRGENRYLRSKTSWAFLGCLEHQRRIKSGRFAQGSSQQYHHHHTQIYSAQMPAYDTKPSTITSKKVQDSGENSGIKTDAGRFAQGSSQQYHHHHTQISSTQMPAHAKPSIINSRKIPIITDSGEDSGISTDGDFASIPVNPQTIVTLFGVMFFYHRSLIICLIFNLHLGCYCHLAAESQGRAARQRDPQPDRSHSLPRRSEPGPGIFACPGHNWQDHNLGPLGRKYDCRGDLLS